MPQRGSTQGGAGRRFERLFVLRLWSEHGSARGYLRGSVVEIKTGHRFFFTQLADLKDFLALYTGEPDDDTSSPPEH